MRIFLPVFLFEGFLSIVLKDYVNSELLVLIYIFINSAVLIFWFAKKSANKTIFYILVGGLLIRLLGLIYDQGVSRLPFNTGDAYKFHELAVETANALPAKLLEHFTGVYSQVLGVIYYIFGPYSFLGNFLNIVFIMLAATKIIDIANLLKFKIRNTEILILLWVFMPIPFLMGYALLREGSIYYFMVLSVYCFLKWFHKYNPMYIVATLGSIFLASLYHEAIFIVLVPFIYTFIFYSKKDKKINMNFINIACITIVLVVGVIYISENGEELFSKTNAETGGGSSYLTSLEITNPVEFMMFAPIKGFYLLFSPMPWLVRGGMDLLTFILDTAIWGGATFYIVKNFKRTETKFKMLLLATILAGLVFGMGTHNTGTAIRHRNKFLSLILVSYIGVKDKCENLIEEELEANKDNMLI